MSENIMRIIDLRGKNLSRAELLAAMPRAAMGTSEATDLVRPILDDVKERGAAALRDFEEKFDHVRPEHLRVPVEAIKDALTTLDPEVRAAIAESVRRARAVAANQVPEDLYTDLAEGGRGAERWIPIQRVGLYVPGGKAVYPSSVIMNAVPAQAAGVESLAIATPPARDNAEGRSVAPRPLPCSHTEPRAPSRRTATCCATRSTRSPARATSSWPPPSRSSPRSWASTRSPAPPRSASSPTRPPTRACWPPT